MWVERRKNFKDWKKILQTVQEIVPSDDFVLQDICKQIDGSYKAFVEDEEYRYEIVFILERSEEKEYRLLDFIWEEKQ